MYGLALMLSIPARTTSKNIDKIKIFIRWGNSLQKTVFVPNAKCSPNSFPEKQPFLHHRMMKGFKGEKKVNNYPKKSTKYILVTFYYMQSSLFSFSAGFFLFRTIHPLEHSKYIYQDSKLLATGVCFAQLVKTSLLAVWTEQQALYI